MAFDAIGFNFDEFKSKIQGVKGIRLNTSKGEAVIDDKGFSWIDNQPADQVTVTETKKPDFLKHPLVVGGILAILGITLRKVIK